jgi:hypothetical protein
MTGNDRNKFSNRLGLNNTSSNVKITERLSKRNESLVKLRTGAEPLFDTRAKKRGDFYKLQIARFGKI